MLYLRSMVRRQLDESAAIAYFTYMRRIRISSTELARSVGEILGRVRYGGESFVIERNGKEVAVLGPCRSAPRHSLREIAEVWISAGPSDPAFAVALERVEREDRPLENPWGSSSTRAP